MSDLNRGQTAQDAVQLSVAVEGFSDWKEALSHTIELSDFWVEEFGKKEATYLEVCNKAAQLQQISRENQCLSALVNEGFQLEEAEVTFRGCPEEVWGKCIWKKDHRSYQDPDYWMRRNGREVPDSVVSLVGAVFETQYEGEKKFTLSSVSVGAGFLFHKAIVFHRIVFSKQISEDEKVA